MFLLQIALRILVGIVILIILVTAGWMVIAGPITVLRIIRFGTTKIDDFKHEPTRAMAASAIPYRFTEHEDRFVRKVEAPIPTGSANDLDALLEDNDTIALLVLKDDILVLERYYQDHTEGSHSQSFSMAKSFTSMLVGLAIEDGLIASVNQPIIDFIPELADEGFHSVTLQHLLTMTSGSSYIENDNPFGIHVILNYTPELEYRILSFRMADEPGSVWRYKSGDNALLGLALKRIFAPLTISEYMQEKVWNPIGMEAPGLWSLDHLGDGLEKTWCCLSATPRDFLKLGRLYLNDGNWDDRRILSSNWIYESTQVGRIPESGWDANYRRIGIWNYGYQWWLVSREEGSYLATGKDGQFLYINPAQKAVVLRLGWSMGKLPLSQWLRLFEYLSRDMVYE